MCSVLLAALAGTKEGVGFADYEIKPTTGKNPFSDMTATPDEWGTYDLYFS
jgi:hypothetical protein